MKVLLQNSLFYPNVIGGAEIAVHIIGAELRRRGLQVDGLATTGLKGRDRGWRTRPTDDSLGTIYEAPFHGLTDLYRDGALAPQPGLLVRGLHHFTQVRSPRWKKLMAGILAESRPDVVHTNTILGMTSSIWEAARQQGIPVLHTLHDYQLLCPRTTLMRSDHSNCVDAPLPCRVLARLKLSATDQVDLVTAPSRYVLERHRQAGGFPGVRAEVVANACEYLPPRVPERAADGPVRGLFLGQVSRHKGVPMLLEALAELFADEGLHDLEFTFAGQGSCVDEVRAFCARHPRRCRYLGVVKGEEKFELLRRSSFQVVPSLWNDNFPLSILDGFSFGLPVIGTNLGGIPEVIGDGREGLVIAPEAPALAAAMASYVRDPQMRLQHGRAARRKGEGYTLERQVDTYVALYGDLLADGKGSS